MSVDWKRILSIEDGAIGYMNSREFIPTYKQDTRDRIVNFMLVSAILSSVVLLLNLKFFKAMYFNRYGHYNPVKDNISDESGDDVI